jgi:tetratricopeptide (TPR) repeat protein
MFMMQGRLPQMKEIADQLMAMESKLPQDEPAVMAQVQHFRSGYAMSTGDMMLGLRHLEATVAAFDRAGDHRNALMERNTLASGYTEMGYFSESERLARINLRECDRARVPATCTQALVILGNSLNFQRERRDDARTTFVEAIERSKANQNRLHEGWAHAGLAAVAYRQGRFAEVEEQANAALSILEKESPTFKTWPLALRARALLRSGRLTEAQTCSEQAIQNLKDA